MAWRSGGGLIYLGQRARSSRRMLQPSGQKKQGPAKLSTSGGVAPAMMHPPDQAPGRPVGPGGWRLQQADEAPMCPGQQRGSRSGLESISNTRSQNRHPGATRAGPGMMGVAGLRENRVGRPTEKQFGSAQPRSEPCSWEEQTSEGERKRAGDEKELEGWRAQHLGPILPN
ncbi:hypothetical protein BO71DRAFT_96555 [Aspergillus ellipticus CBS 707.79]|uniref:Uncharacterized protein n=1 Tax=Aspergillus ellipticus CBS 707.79 TaxID=1448320 RepID=A0A319CXY1_9EURO|nr:hypothetical protein BO71DRAFT_96555 [Aspergillus ellipticus CBS 707.79]